MLTSRNPGLRALREEGIQVAPSNSNPATIMTDVNMAIAFISKPFTIETVEMILQREKPDGIIATMGGQVGLNLALSLHGKEFWISTGCPCWVHPWMLSPGRRPRVVQGHHEDNGQPIPEVPRLTPWEGALDLCRSAGISLIVRPAYTLGGSGGGQAENRVELEAIVTRGLNARPIGQVLIERKLWPAYKKLSLR
jgi:carbamoyl-phosphate synthase large subunit